MCLIISAPKGNQIPLELLQDATTRNADGWGIMWADNGRIHTAKSPRPGAEDIYEVTRKLTHETIVHLRMATHGGNTPENTHPFEVIPNRLYMMHNGIVEVEEPDDRKSSKRSARSDTRIMVEDYLRPLVGKDPSRLHNKGLKNFVQHMIGDYSNRLVFLDDQGKVSYFNKHLGIDWKGLWCSNTYAWSLHSEGREKRRGAWNSSRYSSWVGSSANDRYADSYGFSWADRQYQAAPDPVESSDDVLDLVEERRSDLLVETTFEFLIPEFVADLFDLSDRELADEDPDVLAEALLYLRDNYIGAPR